MKQEKLQAPRQQGTRIQGNTTATARVTSSTTPFHRPSSGIQRTANPTILLPFALQGFVAGKLPALRESRCSQCYRLPSSGIQRTVILAVHAVSGNRIRILHRPQENFRRLQGIRILHVHRSRLQGRPIQHSSHRSQDSGILPSRCPQFCYAHRFALQGFLYWLLQ